MYETGDAVIFEGGGDCDYDELDAVDIHSDVPKRF